MVTGANRTGWSDPGVVNLTVRDTCTVSYDTRGGGEAPAAQTQTIGAPMPLSDSIPVREGCAFLGWTEDPQGNQAVYGPGSSMAAAGDTTLYAVWKEASAAPQALEIRQLPQRTLFLVGEALDTAGLQLQLTYSDGTGQLLTEGFDVTGFDSEQPGTKTVTLAFASLTTSYEVQVVASVPGDIDLNHTVNRDDVMLLLWHITFPTEFPVDAPADLTGDGKVNRDDVMLLLWHITFPDRFPLELPAA